MSQQDRIYKRRIYEGEWWFVCQSPCEGYLTEYSFYEHDQLANHFLANTGMHATQRCHLCSGLLEWAGFSGDTPISDSLISLIKSGHFMASTVILAAITENLINSLFWAVLVDSGIDRERANTTVNGRIGRFDCLHIIKSLSDLKIRDLSFPVRNLVAHGKGFGRGELAYKQEVHKQIQEIRKWALEILNERTPLSFMPSEIDRWLLFLANWSKWLKDYVDQEMLSG